DTAMRFPVVRVAYSPLRCHGGGVVSARWLLPSGRAQQEVRMSDVVLYAAGRVIPDGVDRIRRYCGLEWSGGPPETWAWPYYDAVPTRHDDIVEPTDVVCAAALHPGLGRADLAFFHERGDELSGWLQALPSDSPLWEVGGDVVAHVAHLADRFAEVSISLLSKVL